MILSVGEALIDLMSTRSPDGDEVFRSVPGGSPLNTAIALRRLGVNAGLLSRVSTDMFGERLVSHIEKNGLSRDYLIRADEPSTLAFVSSGPRSAPQYAFYTERTADRMIALDDLPDTLPENVEGLQCGSISLSLEPGATAIEEFVLRNSDRFISFDPNVRASMVAHPDRYRDRIEAISAASSIVKTSDEDLAWVYEGNGRVDAANRLLDLGAGLVVVTRGSAGSEAFRRNRSGATERVDVGALMPVEEGDDALAGPGEKVVDTVGAGDTFHAALISWLQRRGALSRKGIAEASHQELRDAQRFASVCATITCHRIGADPPLLSEVPDRYR